MATVVAKLLNMCRPDVAYFGAKDFQQTVVIQRLVRDLDIPVRIEVCPIVRDPDGLALSSRNAYLSDHERRSALSLKRALDAAERAIRDRSRQLRATSPMRPAASWKPPGSSRSTSRSCPPETSPRSSELGEEDVLIAVAARVGGTRLIDNVVIEAEACRRPRSAAAAT